MPFLTLKLAQQWNLTNLTRVEKLRYNYVLTGFSGDKPVILKISLFIEGLKNEANALKAFSEYGAAKVLDETSGALLLERAIDGYP